MSPRFFSKSLLIVSAIALTIPTGAGAQAPAQCTIDQASGRLPPNIRKTVVITDPKVFEQADFSFARTLGAIVSTSTAVDGGSTDAEPKAPPVNAAADREALLSTLVQTFEESEPVNTNSRVKMTLTRRPGELALKPQELLDPANLTNGMKPIGLFNRLDLAPENKRYCGEHRIVYGKGNLSNPVDRFFLIFEAAVDNPDDNNRVEGCRRIASFWNALATKEGQELASSLENFYYNGDLGDGGAKMTPVVHTQHYGVPFGQVRGNLFVTQGDPTTNPWMLREWRISISPETGKPVFIPDTVKSNPDPRLYAAAGTVIPKELPEFADLRPEFQQNVVLNHVREVIDLELRAVKQGEDKVDPTTLFSNISARLEDQFNSFQSISQSTDDDPLTRANGTDLIDRIKDELGNYKLPPESDLTAEHMLNRIGALSCAGCHHQSVGKEIAKGVNWPAVAETSVPPAASRIGFIHINEKGEVSEALDKHFLPARCENMQNNILKPAPDIEVSKLEALSPGPARSGFNRLQGLMSSIDSAKREEFSTFSARVEEVRKADFQTPGAFYAFRRTH